jgi:hypothetical protein
MKRKTALVVGLLIAGCALNAPDPACSLKGYCAELCAGRPARVLPKHCPQPYCKCVARGPDGGTLANADAGSWARPVGDYQ